MGEHNSRLPHSAFCGQRPDEMNFCTGADTLMTSNGPHLPQDGRHDFSGVRR